MSDRFSDAASSMGGRAQDAMGRAQATAGRVYDQSGNVVNTARDSGNQIVDTIREQPIMAAVVALGIGFLLGKLT